MTLLALVLAAPAAQKSSDTSPKTSETSAPQKSSDTSAKPRRALPADAIITLTHADDPWAGDPRVGTYTSATRGFSTNSFWLEGPTGLVLIDAQFLPSAALEAVDFAERATGKKVVLAIVLHANPDKFNGTLALKSRGIRVVTSAQVRALIPAVFEKRTRAFKSRFEDEWPKDVPLPDSFGDKTTTLEAAGLKLTAHVLGHGCSDAHVVIQWDAPPRVGDGDPATHLFVGDLVANGSHSWLELGHTDEWHQRLDDLAALEPDYIHPGRGPSGDARLLAQEHKYLNEFSAVVATEHPKGALDDATRGRLLEKLDAQFPQHRFGAFLEVGVGAEWARQAAR
ncbi:MAG: MBL fold metallo-hydrolase [Deltaproteobacteria bacterium]|nr:MBL fold metallo-hydrolase [Deltaproteobacteria bacterium]